MRSESRNLGGRNKEIRFAIDDMACVLSVKICHRHLTMASIKRTIGILSGLCFQISHHKYESIAMNILFH